jgi:hypothetical protein
MTDSEPEVTAANLVSELLRAMPELRDTYERMVEIDPTPGLHVICGDMLLAPIDRELAGARPDRTRLQRLFGFIERGITSTDPDVRNAIEFSVLEGLVPSESARNLMGPCSQAGLRRVEAHLKTLTTDYGRMRRVLDALLRVFFGKAGS